jgi:Skp family chaperone for outer membrane proteins
MASSHKAVVTLLSSAIALCTLGGAGFAQTAATKSIGVVDRDKVVTSYTKAQQAADELKKLDEKMQKLVEDANKQYEEAKKANKPPAELEGLQRRLQAQIDDELKKIQARAQGMENQLETEIDSAIKAEATLHKVDIVFSKGFNLGGAVMPVVLSGGVDLTDGVMKRLSASTAAKTQRPTATK